MRVCHVVDVNDVEACRTVSQQERYAPLCKCFEALDDRVRVVRSVDVHWANRASAKASLAICVAHCAFSFDFGSHVVV